MVRITKTELYIKVVYYGPGLSGKTTNLEVIHKQLPDSSKGDLTSIATETDRTIFFDCLPFESKSPDGRILKLQLFTIPGQIYYKSTRQLILRGADGVIFVADSTPEKMGENVESLNDLIDILKHYRVDIRAIPMILQYNKRDLNPVIPLKTMELELNTLKKPSFCASAINRIGTMETLKLMLNIVMERLKLLPKEKLEGEETFKRRIFLTKKSILEGCSNSEWAELIGIYMDPNLQDPVGTLILHLKKILAKERERKEKVRILDICSTIVSLDPGEHKIKKVLQGVEEKSGLNNLSESSFLLEVSSTLDSRTSENSQVAKTASSALKKSNAPVSLAPSVSKKKLEPPSSLPIPPPPMPSISKQETSSKNSIILKLQRQVEEFPSNLTVRKKLLNLYLKNKMNSNAVRELFSTAEIHYKNGSFDLCKKCLQYILRLDSSHREAQILLGKL